MSRRKNRAIDPPVEASSAGGFPSPMAASKEAGQALAALIKGERVPRRGLLFALGGLGALAGGGYILGGYLSSSQEVKVGEGLIASAKDACKKGFLAEFDENDVRQRLDCLAADAKGAIGAESSPTGRFDAFNRFMRDKAGFKPMKPSASRRRLFINEVLAKKEGLCEELTGVYLAVAERLGLPIHAVSAPRHVFIRWDDGSTKINFDPTWNMSLNDEEYMRAFNIHPDAARNGCYLRSMSSREFLSIELNNNLNFFMKRKAPPESLLGLSDALLKDNPLLAEAYLTNAAIMLEAGRPRDALGLSREVVRVDPNYIPGYHIGATALAQMGDYPDSVKMAANGVMVAEETVKTLQKRGHPINNDLLVSVAGLHDVMGFSLVKIHEIEERKGNQENADTALRMAVGFYRSGINMLAGVEGTKDLTDGLKKNLGALGQSQ